jgi:hypothetical protein
MSASSKILTPQPPYRPASVYPPAFGAGGGHTRWVERGVEGQYLENARHSSILDSTLWLEVFGVLIVKH